MTVPIEAKSFRFTPALLKEKTDAPVFTLRYGTRRDKHTFRSELAARGLVHYSDADIRAAMLDEIRRLSENTIETIDRMVDTAKRYWDSKDAHQTFVLEWLKECEELRRDNASADLPPPPENDFDAAEAAWITGIMETVQSQSAVLGNMRRANSRRDRIFAEAALAIVLVSIEGLDITLRRDADGIIERDCIAEIEDALCDRAEELGIEPTESDWVYTDLCDTAFQAMTLPKEAEKNFGSPPQPSSQDTSSKQDPVASDDTQSPASEKSSSKKTRSEADTTNGETSANLPSAAETSGAEPSGQMADASLTSQ